MLFSASRDARLIQSPRRLVSLPHFFLSYYNRREKARFFLAIDKRNARGTTASRRANDRKNGRNAYLDHFYNLFYLRLFCVYKKLTLAVGVKQKSNEFRPIFCTFFFCLISEQAKLVPGASSLSFYRTKKERRSDGWSGYMHTLSKTTQVSIAFLSLYKSTTRVFFSSRSRSLINHRRFKLAKLSFHNLSLAVARTSPWKLSPSPSPTTNFNSSPSQSVIFPPAPKTIGTSAM